jgi:DUF1009 family protein
MGERLGVIAGSGAFPLRALGLIREKGFEPVVAGVRGQAAEALSGTAPSFAWFGPADFEALVGFFRESGVREIVLVGKIDPAVLVRGDGGAALSAFLERLPSAAPAAVLEHLIAALAARGLAVKDPGFLLAPYFRPAGLLGRIAPPAAASADIAFAWPLVRTLADLDIGQTLVVKGRAVVAVEGMDGTDATILRAGRIAGPGCVVLKCARTDQDLRVDVPGIGLGTVRACVEAGAAVLAVEAGRVAVFELPEASALADANGLTLIATEGPSRHG